ncbi:hypothetical protein ACU4GR_01580 [Methylobacterium oryzae CBMB20]
MPVVLFFLGAIAILVAMVWIVIRAHERKPDHIDGVLISASAICVFVGVVFAMVHAVDREPRWVARLSQAAPVR